MRTASAIIPTEKTISVIRAIAVTCSENHPHVAAALMVHAGDPARELGPFPASGSFLAANDLRRLDALGSVSRIDYKLRLVDDVHVVVG